MTDIFHSPLGNPLGNPEDRQTEFPKEGNNRLIRAQELRNTDWTQFNDSPLTDEKKAEWAEYRQKLRDITKQETWPNNPVWPEAPSV